MRNPIENLPLQEMTRAVFQRLEGNIYKLDMVTAFPIYDAFPDTLSSDRYDHVELAGFDMTPESPAGGLSQYSYTGIIKIFSSYNGQKEIESVTEQVNSLLASRLSLTGFTDIGSSFRRAQLENVVVEGESEVIRMVTYRRQWILSDHGR